jgi:hypothetical protein
MKVKSIEQLKKLASNENGVDCFIALAGGLARSSKQVWYLNGKWEVFNSIDDTEQVLTDGQLHTDSNIGEAIDKGCLYLQ